MDPSTQRLLRLKRIVLIPPVIASILYIYFLRSFSSRRRSLWSSLKAAIVGERRSSRSSSVPNQTTTTTSKSSKVGVNRQFYLQMKRLLPVLVPGPFSMESGLLVSLASVLIARTWLDIWFSAFNGQVVKAIVSRDKATFVARAGIEFLLMMWPLSIVNNSLKLLINALSLAFRRRLTQHAHNMYLNGITFYKVSNIDNRIQNADQLLTQDIDRFSDNLAHLYSDVTKPLVDIFLFAYKLGQAIGGQGNFSFVSVGHVHSAVVHGRLLFPIRNILAIHLAAICIITHSEEIAFYGGSEREKEYVNESFNKIVKHLRKIYTLRFANGIIDSVLVKYCATIMAYWLLSRPVFDPKYATEHMGKVGADATKIMEDYSRNSSYLVNLSQAVGRVILAGRDLTRFAGYTSRVAELFEVLDEVNRGSYQRSMVGKDEKAGTQVKRVDKSDLQGQVEISQDGTIEFQHVPIVTPNGDLLVKELDFKVSRGMNTLISGPNGCGKSSLFRILGDLWPLFGGKIRKPDPHQLFYVPQKPYLALGTLRDQVIYPHAHHESLHRGVTDDHLRDLLNMVHLGYLIDREGGFDAVQDWADVLSGGEKQRGTVPILVVAMARLFYHQPQWAILDECTSAVSVDVEGIMYTQAKKLGITLFTVSHRTSLFKYHEYLLRFDGHGGYEFMELEEGDTKAPFAFSTKTTVAK